MIVVRCWTCASGHRCTACGKAGRDWKATTLGHSGRGRNSNELGNLVALGLPEGYAISGQHIEAHDPPRSRHGEKARGGNLGDKMVFGVSVSAIHALKRPP